MTRYTVDEILKLNPCSPYTRRKIQKLWGKRKSLALVSIMKLGIPVEDKLWVACRLIDHRSSVSWACDCAGRVLPTCEKEYPKDKRPRKAIKITRAWVAGKATLEEVGVAADAAADAAYAAADADAAYAADAAASAADAAYAADAATYAAASAADAAADAAAERTWQSKRILEYIRGEAKSPQGGAS